MARHSMRITIALGALLACACSQQRREERRSRAAETAQIREENRAAREESSQQGRAADARERLDDQHGALEHGNARPEDVTQARNELAQASRELTDDVARACEGLSVRQQEACPVDSHSIASVEDIRNGVKVHLASAAGSAETVEQRIGCHNARRELDMDQAARTGRPIETRAGCFLDVLGVQSDVDDHRGAVTVSVTTHDEGKLEQVRSLARHGVSEAPPLRTTGGHVGGH